MLIGEFDQSSSGRLDAIAEQIAGRPRARLRIDAAGVTFASAALISALIRLHRIITLTGGTIGFATLSPRLARLLDVTNMATMLDASNQSMDMGGGS